MPPETVDDYVGCNRRRWVLVRGVPRLFVFWFSSFLPLRLSVPHYLTFALLASSHPSRDLFRVFFSRSLPFCPVLFIYSSRCSSPRLHTSSSLSSSVRSFGCRPLKFELEKARESTYLKYTPVVGSGALKFEQYSTG
jgi:hypothetical protein